MNGRDPWNDGGTNSIPGFIYRSLCLMLLLVLLAMATSGCTSVLVPKADLEGLQHRYTQMQNERNEWREEIESMRQSTSCVAWET